MRACACMCRTRGLCGFVSQAFQSSYALSAVPPLGRHLRKPPRESSGSPALVNTDGCWVMVPPLSMCRGSGDPQDPSKVLKGRRAVDEAVL